MSDRINSLPLEIILIILSHLPLRSLLAFGATSRLNYEHHVLAFKHLRLAVFQRRVHSTISFLQAGWTLPNGMPTLSQNSEREDFGYTVAVILPRIDYLREDIVGCACPLRKKELRACNTAANRQRQKSLKEMIRIQNGVFTKVLSRYGASLNHLELMAYDLNVEGAAAVGTNCGRSLRHLALRFEHPHVRNGLIKPDAWFRPAEPSTAWNALIGIGPYKHIGDITSLKSLTLERAGITPWQLSRLVKRNPGLTTLKLRTCNGAQPEFLHWLGGLVKDDENEEEVLDEKDDGEEVPAPGAQLKALWLENCQQLLPDPNEILDSQNQFPEACDRGLEWVRGLRNLESISFSECTNLPSTYVETANKMLWHIPELILPYPLHQKTNSSDLEVDPSLL